VFYAKLQAQAPGLSSKCCCGPGEIADQHVARIADERRVDVFVTRGQLLHRVDVRAAFVRERRRTHPRLARVVPEFAISSTNWESSLSLASDLAGTQVFFQLQRHARNDTGQICNCPCVRRNR